MYNKNQNSVYKSIKEMYGHNTSATLNDQSRQMNLEEQYLALDEEIDEAILAIAEEENVDLSSLTEKQMDEFIGGALKKIGKKIGSGIKSRVTTTGRTDRANKKADKIEKKTADRDNLNKAKERLKAAKAARK